MPPTIAVPDVGRSRPHSIRMVVDLPAPLLPRNPKISPRAHVERHVVDGDELSRTAGSGADLDRRWPVRLPSVRVIREPSLPDRALQPRFGEAGVGERARAIELGLQHARSARRARRCSSRRRRGSARRRRARASAARADPVGRRGDRGPAGVELRARAAALRRSTWRSKSSTRASSGARRGGAPPPARRARRPPSQSDHVTLTDASHESCHCAARGKMRGFGRA